MKIDFSNLTFIGLEAALRYETQCSVGFELLRRHNERESSLMGWLDINYPCKGPHRLYIRACLDPSLAVFDDYVNFGGDPSTDTERLIHQLVDEVRQRLSADPAVSWHLDLQCRGIGTFFEDPPKFI